MENELEDFVKQHFKTNGIPKPEKIKYTDEKMENKPVDKLSQLKQESNMPPVYYSEGNIKTVEQFAGLIKKLLELTAPEISFISQYDYQSLKDVQFPIVTYDINNREKNEQTGLKPHPNRHNAQNPDKEDYNNEVNKYSLLMDCIIEFDIYGLNDAQSAKTMETFENILMIYTGYLKKQGVSEMYFLQQIPARASVNYIKATPMKCLLWYVRLENIYLVRQSMLEDVYLKLNDYLKNKIE